MNTAWPEVALGDLCDVQIGKTPPRKEQRFWGSGYRWLSIADMDQGRDLRQTSEQITQEAVDELRCRPVEPGTVLLSFKLSIGKVGIARKPLFTNEAIAHLPILDTRLDRDFLYWALRTIPLTPEADRAAMGATLNKAKVKRLPIPLPPLDEQRRIAAVLDAADALRVKRRKVLDKLDDLVRALFVDLFGDVDKNDRGWPMHPVGEFVESFETGKSVAAGPDDIPGGYRVLKVSAVTSWRFDVGESKPVPADYSPPSRHVVRQGDLLMSRANTTELVGACALVREVPDRHLLPDKLWRFIWKDSLAVEPLYVWMVLQGRRARRLIGDLASGSSGSMKNISQQKFLRVELPIPPIDQQRLFVERLEAVARIEAEANRATAGLNHLFGSLQQRAFRGDL